MANKALAKRQKMTMRTEPSQKAPRSPAAVPAAASAKHSGSGSRNGALKQAPLLQRLLAKKSSV
nr:hypothetical protein [Noviherbaspirillum pedocola]